MVLLEAAAGPDTGQRKRCRPQLQRPKNLPAERLGPGVGVHAGHSQRGLTAAGDGVPQHQLPDEWVDVGVLQQRGKSMPQRKMDQIKFLNPPDSSPGAVA